MKKKASIKEFPFSDDETKKCTCVSVSVLASWLTEHIAENVGINGILDK